MKSRAAALNIVPAGHARQPLGMDPPDRVVLMENHDAAYTTWRSAGVADRVLVHIDAHHDLEWRDPARPLAIGNFISAAVAEGVIREIFWVVPDTAWKTTADRRAIIKQMRTLIAGYPRDGSVLRIGADKLSTSLLGKPVTVCPLASVPLIGERVLLDIDIDYLVVAHIYGESDAHRHLPWCWPEDLVARLGAARLRSDLVTVAYSVDGGYTPLKWKYLADELEARLKIPGAALPGFESMREGARAAFRGDRTSADERYRRAAELMPASPAPAYHQALLALDGTRPEHAREYFATAVRRDPSYRTAFANSGLAYFRERRFAEAAREHRQALILDPADGYAHFGLGRLAALDERWTEAEAELRQSIALDGKLVDAYRVLGYVLAHENRLEEAIAAYDHSLRLTLEGFRPLDGPIATGPITQRFDADHCRIHAAVARLYASKGDVGNALAGYRMAIAGGEDNTGIRWRLAALYVRNGDWPSGARQIGPALRRLPGDLRRAGRWAWRYLREVIRARGRLPRLVPSGLS